MNRGDKFWLYIWIPLMILVSLVICYCVKVTSTEYTKRMELGYEQVTVQGSADLYWQKSK